MSTVVTFQGEDGNVMLSVITSPLILNDQQQLSIEVAKVMCIEVNSWEIGEDYTFKREPIDDKSYIMRPVWSDDMEDETGFVIYDDVETI